MAEPLEKTYAMIKPDAVRSGNAENITHIIEANNFTIVAQAHVQLTRERAEEFYAEHTGKPFFDGLVDFMSSGPIVALVLCKPGAIKAWRALAGPTDSNKARAEAPDSIRALYGTDGRQNAVHGSDSPESARREIKFFFPKIVVDPLPEPQSAQEYVERELAPILTAALTALAKAKPSSVPLEAIKWLADWLEANNPNKPKVVLPDEVLPPREGGPEGQSGAGAQVGATQGEELLPDDQAEMEAAATKLQASFRGYLTRKEDLLHSHAEGQQVEVGS